jgi:hypothetical protein
VSSQAEENSENTEEDSNKEEIIPIKLTQTEITKGTISRKENENKQKEKKFKNFKNEIIFF